MPNYTFKAIYIGTFSDMDPDETNWTSENANALVGMSFGSNQNPLYQQIEDLTLEDADGDGITQENDMGQTPEDVTFQGASSELDSVVEYTVRLSFVGGGQVEATMVALQDDMGRVFLAPYADGSIENDVFDDAPIQSIKITSLFDDEYMGAYSDRDPNAFVVCFAQGTRLRTPAGEVAVEDMQIGEYLQTLDNGPQPVVWIGQEEVRAAPRTAPIHIGAGALGRDGAGRPLPAVALRVSPQHRVLIASRIAERLFGTPEVFVPAKKLLGLDGITQATGAGVVRYWHVMLPAHEVVFADGAPVESFLPGPMALQALSKPCRASLFATRPGLRAGLGVPSLARPHAKGEKLRLLLQRHEKNGKALVDGDILARHGCDNQNRPGVPGYGRSVLQNLARLRRQRPAFAAPIAGGAGVAVNG